MPSSRRPSMPALAVPRPVVVAAACTAAAAVRLRAQPGDRRQQLNLVERVAEIELGRQAAPRSSRRSACTGPRGPGYVAR
jgi:hypothetical protein